MGSSSAPREQEKQPVLSGVSRKCPRGLGEGLRVISTDAFV